MTAAMATPDRPRIPFGPRATAAEVLSGIDLRGRTMLVTGCNSGLGLETMRVLAAHGAHIVGLARSAAAAAAACAGVTGETTPVACDQADLDSVVSAIAAVRALGRPLDAIVANAGVMGGALARLYGVERQFLINHVAHALLVTRLADCVPDGSGRIVVVSSSASYEAAPKRGILFDNLDAHEGYRPLRFYGQSKLANALFARELSRRLAVRGVAANAAHPGVIFGTRLMRGYGRPGMLFAAVAKHFGRSVAQGAATQTLLAGSPLVAGVSGMFWADCQIAKGSPHLRDRAMAERLWTMTEDIIRRSVTAPPTAVP
jgi:WW domain-containing oxidoreductase